MTDISQLEQRARDCSQRGDPAGTEQACLAILEQQPDHQVFLGSDAEEKLSLGDLLDLTLHLSLHDRGCGRPYLAARPQRELL